MDRLRVRNEVAVQVEVEAHQWAQAAMMTHVAMSAETRPSPSADISV